MPAARKRSRNNNGTYGIRNGGYKKRRNNYNNHSMIKPYQRGYLRESGFYNMERKFLDTTQAPTTALVIGDVTSETLNIIPEGNGQSARVGRKVNLTSIGIRGSVKIASTSTLANTGDVVRIMVVQDKQTNGASPAVATVLQSADYNAFGNLANRNRFVILRDKFIAIQSQSGSFDGTNDGFAEAFVFFKDYFKVNIPIEYDASATDGSLATQRSNNIFVLVISAEGIANVDYRTRLRYTDC